MELLTVERMATTGQGVARAADGRVVLLHGGLPGERVRAGWSQLRGTAQGELQEVLEASAERRTPSCDYAARCGGCDWMHIADKAQLVLQQEALAQLFRRAGFEPLPRIVAHRCGPPQRYRQRARLSLRAKGGALQLGYHRRRAHRLVDIDDCLVLEPALAATFAGIRSMLRGASGEGEAMLSLGPDTAADRRALVSLHWRGQLPATAYACAAERVADGSWSGARIWLDGTRQPASFGEVRSCSYAHDGYPLYLPTDGFAQPSQHANLLLAERVAALVAEQHAATLVELFAGAGTLTVALAGHCDKLIAVEEQPAAVAALRENLRLRHFSVIAKEVDANRFKLPRPCHTVVLDPPRGGAAGAMEQIITGRVKQVVYLACDPVTLVRDATTLRAAGYRLTHLELMGIFPQTHHFETLIRMVRGRTHG